MAALRQRTHLRLVYDQLCRVGVVSLFFATLNASNLHAATPDRPITVNEGRYGPYYHLRLELKAGDIDFTQSDRTAHSGGQFEISLRRDKFPVPAPNCRGPIILRMPWTSPAAMEAQRKIAEKENVLRRIAALQNHPNAALPVVVELNPYVEIVHRTPLSVRLTQCNVFFRDADGAYIDHTRAVAPSRVRP